MGRILAKQNQKIKSFLKLAYEDRDNLIHRLLKHRGEPITLELLAICASVSKYRILQIREKIRKEKQNGSD